MGSLEKSRVKNPKGPDIGAYKTKVEDLEDYVADEFDKPDMKFQGVNDDLAMFKNSKGETFELEITHDEAMFLYDNKPASKFAKTPPTDTDWAKTLSEFKETAGY